MQFEDNIQVGLMQRQDYNANLANEDFLTRKRLNTLARALPTTGDTKLVRVPKA
jgi:hypothetical protein